jgi:hypothetical protein
MKTSFPAARDTSAEARADASAAARRDVLPREGCDASLGSARDASAVVEPDASTASASDASRPPCAWCGVLIPAAHRRDSVCCSKRCRQARHRFGRAAGRALAAAAVAPLRLAYADPPYPGNAYKYRGHSDYAGEVDHAALIARLGAYDGWALSTSAAALPAVLPLCPSGVRVGAWHRGPRGASSWQPLSAWEPVIYVPARPVDPARGARSDSFVHGVSAMTTLAGRVVGTKPAAVCRWIFDLLGAAPGDTLDDLFPGSGAVTRAWAVYTADASLTDAADGSSPVISDASARARSDASFADACHAIKGNTS